LRRRVKGGLYTNGGANVEDDEVEDDDEDEDDDPAPA